MFFNGPSRVSCSGNGDYKASLDDGDNNPTEPVLAPEKRMDVFSGARKKFVEKCN
jgi:hypothetical protein